MIQLTPEIAEEAMRFMLDGTMGGFAAKLADAWFVADSGNRQRIEQAFEGLIQRTINFKRTRPDDDSSA